MVNSILETVSNDLAYFVVEVIRQVHTWNDFVQVKNVILDLTLLLSDDVIDFVWNLQAAILELNNGEHAYANELNEVVKKLLNWICRRVVSIPNSGHGCHRKVQRGIVLLLVVMWIYS
jgi:hypothetical protein